MNTSHHIHHLEPIHDHNLRVDLMRPFHWLESGYRDFSYHPTASFAYGAIVAALLFVTYLMSGGHIYAIAAAMCAFMFVGPILAAGLCELSWRHETNEPLSFDQSIDRLKQCRSTLLHFATVLLGFSVLWLALAAIVLSITVGSIAPPVMHTLWGDFFALATMQQIVLYILIGGILAVVAFSVSVVSIPAIIETGISVKEAMLLSFKVFITNIPTMFVWGALLVSLSFIGIVSFFLGMVLLFPLMGHATWYAYRDLVVDEISS